MVTCRAATGEDIETLQNLRMEMLRVVNELPDDYIFTRQLVSCSEEYFRNGNQTSVLAFDDAVAIGCATICYIEMQPTYAHPTGKRAHLMNVYVRDGYRSQGIAKEMVLMLIDDARQKRATEISLDATELGRPLYRVLGFRESQECMTLLLNN